MGQNGLPDFVCVIDWCHLLHVRCVPRSGHPQVGSLRAPAPYMDSSKPWSSAQQLCSCASTGGWRGTEHAVARLRCAHRPCSIARTAAVARADPAPREPNDRYYDVVQNGPDRAAFSAAALCRWCSCRLPIASAPRLTQLPRHWPKQTQFARQRTSTPIKSNSCSLALWWEFWGGRVPRVILRRSACLLATCERALSEGAQTPVYSRCTSEAAKYQHIFQNSGSGAGRG